MLEKMIAVCVFLIMFSGMACALDIQWSEDSYDTGALVSDSSMFSSSTMSFQLNNGSSDSSLDRSIQKYDQYFNYGSGGSQDTGVQAFDITGQEPLTLYFGQSQLSFSQYRSLLTTTNSLWIQGTNSWTQYTQCPLYSSLLLVATASMPGQATVYEIYPNGMTNKKNYYFDRYNHISFYADSQGQHILLFVLNNQPSNAVIIDVQQNWNYGGGFPSGTGMGSTMGLAQINVVSNSLMGYEVIVDNIDRYKDTDDGFLDGRISFTVTGNANHKIVISRGGTYYSQTKYFSSGRSYTMTI